MNKLITGLAGMPQTASACLRRRALITTALLALAVVPAVAHAQQVPGTRVDAAQVSRGLSQAMQGFSVNQGWGYVGDCGVSTPDNNQLCSEVFATDDGAVYVELIDLQHSAVFMLQATVGANGMWELSGDTVPSIALT